MRALPLGGAVAAVAVALAPPAAAPASVRVTRDRVVLTTAHARAVVQRSPFRLAVGVPDGRTVLREVPPGRGAGPVALPVTDDPEPFAREDHPDHAVYAPLTFEVGRERIEQWQGSFWSGNLLRARRSGTVHRATRVCAPRRPAAACASSWPRRTAAAGSSSASVPTAGARCACGSGPCRRAA